MEPSREDAKGAIVSRNQDDPELDETLAAASDFRLQLLKENNRHAESMRGMVSKLFGNGSNTPVYVAATGMVFGIFASFALFCIASQKISTEAGIWMQQAERLLAFSATCVAFIFGKGLNKE